jgi:hypothetical protein
MPEHLEDGPGLLWGTDQLRIAFESADHGLGDLVFVNGERGGLHAAVILV